MILQRILVLILFVLTSYFLNAQIQTNKAVFKTITQVFYENEILRDASANTLQQKTSALPKVFKVDMTDVPHPKAVSDFKVLKHNPPVSQGNSGTCWSFAVTSFMESEIERITGKRIKLSEMYLVYCDYVERAMQFVDDRGKTYFAEGSEANALKRWLDVYGIMPYEAYSGMLPGQKVHNHEKMFEAMENYLQKVKENGLWNKEEVRKQIISILDTYMGKPPQKFKWENKEFTALEFRKEYLPLQSWDWVSFISFTDGEYNQKMLLKEKDNWWNSNDYYNIELNDFCTVVKDAIDKGYSVCICGDVSEPGWNVSTQTSIVPTFDIPYNFINADARQMRWENETTTDDHCMHIVGITQQDGFVWYLLKDSGAGSFDGKEQGYHFMREDYLKLKMVNAMMHKDAARKVLDKIIK